MLAKAVHATQDGSLFLTGTVPSRPLTWKSNDLGELPNVGTWTAWRTMRRGVECNVGDVLFVERDGLQAAQAKAFLTHQFGNACRHYVVADVQRRVRGNTWRRNSLEMLSFGAVVEPCTWAHAGQGCLAVLPPASVAWMLRND